MISIVNTECHVPKTFSDLAKIAAWGRLGHIGEKIAAAALQLGSKAFDRAKVALEIGFQPYLEKSYQRCRYYKTLLNPYEPCDLESTYIHVGLERRSGPSRKTDDNLIQEFLDGKKYVVTGLAGCGKSMFMRYATLKTFESSRNLPLFFELRKLNGASSDSLVKNIYDETTPDGGGVTFAQFKLALRSGLFALILDGFDEVEYDKRREISSQIKNLTLDYSNCPIIISSRPDTDVFTSWSEFKIYDVEKFDKRQTVALIENANYDAGVKRRFLKALNERLFSSHGDFLNSPLLSIIMLLTYEEFAEIPTKMHAFYARAFDTLFQKHDADKEQFVRKIKTGLSREDFKLV